MKFFSRKDKRKQAEESIIRDMAKIRERLDKHRAEENDEENQKKRVMSVLTRFVQLKKDTKLH